MGKVKGRKGSGGKSQGSAAVTRDGPIGTRKTKAERATDALKVFTGLMSLDVSVRLANAMSLASLWEGGTPEEYTATAAQIVSAGGLRQLITRLLDGDIRVRLHVLGGMRNMCIACGPQLVEMFVKEEAVAPVIAGLQEYLKFELGAGEGCDSVALAHNASAASEALLLLSHMAECNEGAVAELVTSGCPLLLEILSVAPATPSSPLTKPSAAPKVRYAAAKLLHTLTEHNDVLCRMARGAEDAKALIGRICTSGPECEHPLTALHCAGVLANMYLQPVLNAGYDSLPTVDVHRALDVVIPSLLAALAWRPASALDAVVGALNCGRTAYMAVGQLSTQAQSAQAVIDADRTAKARARARERIASGVSTPTHGDDAGGDAGGDGDGDGGGDVDGGVEDEEDALAGSGAGAGVTGDDAVAPEGSPLSEAYAIVRAHQAGLTAARHARSAFQATRRSTFAQLRALCLALELLANLAGAADEVAEAGDDEEARRSPHATTADESAHGASGGAGGESEMCTPAQVQQAVFQKLVHHNAIGAVGSLLSAIFDSLHLRVTHDTTHSLSQNATHDARGLSEVPDAAWGALPLRYRRAMALLLVAAGDRACAATANLCAVYGQEGVSESAGGAIAPLWVGVSDLCRSLLHARGGSAATASATHGSSSGSGGGGSTCMPTSLWCAAPDYSRIAGGLSTEEVELYTSIDESLDSNDANGGIEEEGEEAVGAPSERAGRLTSAIASLHEPFNWDYGDEAVADFALGPLIQAAAATSSSSGEGGDASKQLSAEQLANVLSGSDDGIANVPKYTMAPNMLLGLFHLTGARKAGLFHLTGARKAAEGCGWAVSDADLELASHIAISGLYACVATSSADASSSNNMSELLHSQASLASVDLEARCHAVHILAAAASPLSDTDRRYIVDGGRHAMIATVLTTILQSAPPLALTVAAADALMDMYADEEHNDAFVSAHLLPSCKALLHDLHARLTAVSAARRAGLPPPVDAEGMDRAALAYAREVGSNLGAFVEYKESTL